jgi:hypothetical protein
VSLPDCFLWHLAQSPDLQSQLTLAVAVLFTEFEGFFGQDRIEMPQ